MLKLRKLEKMKRKIKTKIIIKLIRSDRDIYSNILTLFTNDNKLKKSNEKYMNTT